jgi:hypothetical protein
MTEYIQQFRFYCRNPRCRMRFKTPVSNPREAFCTRGCHSGFYRKRCLVCEGEMVRRSENQRICGKRRCRNALSHADSLNLGRYALSPVDPIEKSIKSGIKSGDTGDRPWLIVAGPTITANVYHCATVPEGPDCQWRGGEYERIEAKNRAALSAAIERRPKCLSSPGMVFSDWRPVVARLPKGVEPDDRAIPDFLRRIPKLAGIYSKLIPQLPENTETPDFIGTIIIQKHTTNMSSVAFST